MQNTLFHEVTEIVAGAALLFQVFDIRDRCYNVLPSVVTITNPATSKTMLHL